ncbi:biotin synthase [Arthrobacter alpinus]|uniref:Biotin synthase n=1 Tax=Arthrobacter alpinus TaxID=656366 RepID=A0A0S2M2R8_9MICC|nr:biotin synthase BioB [Arthrobacter alpinus]ALO68069.1 biotin synthase [Arthrobacter alpinus]
MFNYFADLASRQLDGATLTREEALAILESADDQLLDLVAAAARLRRAHFANTVKVNYLVNLKSGLCPEDCTYCSQRLGSAAQILKYTWLKPEEAVAQAANGIRAGASRVCLVASGKGPSDRDVDRVAGMVGNLKEQYPAVEVCACLGILKEGQAQRLAASGADAYNHNLNTSEENYAEICSTHTFAERVQTVEYAKEAGLSPCSGLIVGMGESNNDLIDAVFALRDLGSDSIPVNFLMPFDGTPLEDTWLLTPTQCLRILALVRFACPDTELRLAGGREMHLRTLQPLALHVANSLFLGDYLTSEGQSGDDDLAMIADNGFVVLGSEPSQQQKSAGKDSAGKDSAHRARDGAGPSAIRPVTIRRRGAGTAVAPNA